MKRKLSLMCAIMCCLAIVFAAGCETGTETGSGTVVEEPKHEHVYVKTVVEPTCQEEGYTLYECQCGESYKEDPVAKVGHRGKGQCEWCALDYFTELKNLIIKYGTLTSDGSYIYVGTPLSLGGTAAAIYDGEQIHLDVLLTYSSSDFFTQLIIPPLSGGTSIKEGVYVWEYSVSTDSETYIQAIGTIDGAVFSDSTETLKITVASGITTSTQDAVRNLVLSDLKGVLNNLLVPLLYKSPNNITPAHFGFMNY